MRPGVFFWFRMGLPPLDILSPNTTVKSFENGSGYLRFISGGEWVDGWNEGSGLQNPMDNRVVLHPLDLVKVKQVKTTNWRGRGRVKVTKRFSQIHLLVWYDRVVHLVLNQSQTLETNIWIRLCGGLFPKMKRGQSATLYESYMCHRLRKTYVGNRCKENKHMTAMMICRVHFPYFWPQKTFRSFRRKSRKCSVFFSKWKLVRGFSPFEKYESKWESSPSRAEVKNSKKRKPPPRNKNHLPDLDGDFGVLLNPSFINQFQGDPLRVSPISRGHKIPSSYCEKCLEEWP